MDNLYIYEKTRSVPEDAQKPIKAGRLKGMTDINPMWRIKILTEIFGVCGIGWKTQIVRTWLDEGANGEVTANVEILLYIRDTQSGEWSEGIPGIGGSKLISKESSGLYTDDECYKKAHTDAISVACKALGIGADIYWNDNTKYSGNENENSPAKPSNSPQSAPKEPPLTYDEALEFKLADGCYAGNTLREVWKADATFIKQLSENPNTPPRLLEAIRVINAEIVKARANNAGAR